MLIIALCAMRSAVSGGFLFDFVDEGVKLGKFFLYILGEVDLEVEDLFPEKGQGP